MAPKKKQREELLRDEWILDASNEGRTKRKWIDDRGMSRTQTWHFAFSMLGVLLLVWEWLSGYQIPRLFDQDPAALVLVLPVLGIIGKETVAAVFEGIAKVKSGL